MDGTTQSMRHHMVVNSQLETATQAGQIFPLPLESLFYHVSTGTVYMYTSPAWISWLMKIGTMNKLHVYGTRNCRLYHIAPHFLGPNILRIAQYKHLQAMIMTMRLEVNPWKLQMLGLYEITQDTTHM